jgi:deoxyribodipyrimidine photo-lyase
MNLKDIHNSRIQILNDLDLRQGAFVLYWMQQSQRAEYNHALEYAVQQANKMDQGVLVVFGLMDDYPGASGDPGCACKARHQNGRSKRQPR